MDDFKENSFYQENLNIGELLRSNREAQGLSLEQVAERLRIRLVFLKGLEDGRIDQLPGIVYASGFLRAYAELLGLNSEALVQRFRSEHQTQNKQPKLMFPAPVPQSGVPAAVMVLFSLVIIIGAYIGWYKMSGHQNAALETIPSLAGNDQQQNQQDMRISPQIASIMPSERPSLTPQEQQGIAENIKRIEAEAQAEQDKQHDGITPIPDNTPKTQEVAVHNQPVVTKSKISLYAKQSSRLLVKDKDNHVLYKDILKQGERWTLPDDVQEVSVNIGNAGAVVLEKNDRQSDPIGKRGRSIRRFIINEQTLEKFFPTSTTLSTSSQTLNENAKNKNVKSDDAGMNRTNLQVEESGQGKTTSEQTLRKPKNKNKRPTQSQSQTKELTADELNARQLNR